MSVRAREFQGIFYLSRAASQLATSGHHAFLASVVSRPGLPGQRRVENWRRPTICCCLMMVPDIHTIAVPHRTFFFFPFLRVLLSPIINSNVDCHKCDVLHVSTSTTH